MEKELNVMEILTRDHPKGNYNESDLWEAIEESDGYALDYYADGDLAEWL
jgi:hypothetical protein